MRNSCGRDDGVVAKDAAEIVFIGKDFILHRQEDAGRIDEVNYGQGAFKSDALGANQLLGGLRKEGAGFYSRIVGDDHARNAGDVTDAGDSPRGGNVSPLLVHFVSRPEPDLEKLRVFVKQKTDAFSRRQSPHLALTFMAGFAAAFAQNGFFLQNCRALIAQRFAGRRCRCTGHGAEAGLIRGGA